MRLRKGEIQTSETEKVRNTDKGEMPTSETEKERDTENMSVQSLHFQLLDVAFPIDRSGYNLERLH